MVMMQTVYYVLAIWMPQVVCVYRSTRILGIHGMPWFSRPYNEDIVYADLQKIVMISKVNTLNTVLFTKCLTTYNEAFVLIANNRFVVGITDFLEKYQECRIQYTLVLITVQLLRDKFF